MTETIQPCATASRPAMLTIINEAAQAYRGKIPDDCWHDPYMTTAEFEAEIEHGVVFTGFHTSGCLAGIMGIQAVRNVTLIRHAYVRRDFQGKGVGSALIRHLCRNAPDQILVGTWAAASWAISFYESHGFELVEQPTKDRLLSTYWAIPKRQAEASVVLAFPALDTSAVAALIDDSLAS